MEKQLNAFAIGPDRFDVVIGYEQESVIAWYEKETGVTDWGNIREFPMDKPLLFEGEGSEPMTLREFVKDADEFPMVACFSD